MKITPKASVGKATNWLHTQTILQHIPKKYQEIPHTKQLPSISHAKQILTYVQHTCHVPLNKLLKNPPRKRMRPGNIAIYLCRIRYQLTNLEIANLFQLNHYISAASAVSRLEKDPALLKRAQQISKQIS